MNKFQQNPDYDDEEPYLELIKTRLLVVGRELQRLNTDGGVLLRLPIDDIQRVEFKKFLEWPVLVFFGVGAALAAIGYYVSENNILSSILYVVTAFIVGFGLIGMFGRYIVVHSSSGVNTINCSDLDDEGEGFVTSLRRMMGSRE